VRPVLEPLLLGAAPRTRRHLAPDQQAVLGAWAVKTALLLTLGKFRNRDYGWVPHTTLRWLYYHRALQLPPPGARVWMGGVSTNEVPAYVQAASVYDDSGAAAAQCVTFSAGCVVFQVFATEQKDADLSPENEAWLAPAGQYAPALLQPLAEAAGERPEAGDVEHGRGRPPDGEDGRRDLPARALAQGRCESSRLARPELPCTMPIGVRHHNSAPPVARHQGLDPSPQIKDARFGAVAPVLPVSARAGVARHGGRTVFWLTDAGIAGGSDDHDRHGGSG
jgi:hypothetical protein